MTPEQILAEAPRVLTQEQREFYFESGYLTVESLIPDETVERIKEATAEAVERSTLIAESDTDFDLADDHRADSPKVRRLKGADSHHETYWDFAKGLVADVAADLVGPDVVFHHAKLNFKHAGGSHIKKWHQDIPFHPHTNYNMVTIGTLLTDTEVKDGPLVMVPGSNNGPVYDHYDLEGNWVGALSSEDVAAIDEDSVAYLTGPAGTITVHNCRTVHSSPAPSEDAVGRPLLLNIYAAADAMPYTANPMPTGHSGTVVRGSPARWAHHDPRPALLPPWAKGG
ncbi:MAG: phytanoyl-CoA dioxygenase family protein [Acidimicrobiia bacterium]|nr:phytanoyl-CoA dioxygenase family protein [Acidimicrobiia bacterium]MYF84014.1 phytanoyl-CoA dioxygenase family protein [Acidimicrobiia bacterium]